MGRPKALLSLDGVPLVLAHVRALRSAGLAVYVVVGAHAARIRAVLPPDVRVVPNLAWRSTGLSDSLRLALAELDVPAPAVVTPVDVPPVPHPVLVALLEHGAPCVPQHDGADGHPILIAPSGLGAGTLREALADAPRVAVPWADTVVNLNTPQQWQAWLGER